MCATSVQPSSVARRCRVLACLGVRLTVSQCVGRSEVRAHGEIQKKTRIRCSSFTDKAVRIYGEPQEPILDHKYGSPEVGRYSRKEGRKEGKEGRKIRRSEGRKVGRLCRRRARPPSPGCPVVRLSPLGTSCPVAQLPSCPVARLTQTHKPAPVSATETVAGSPKGLPTFLPSYHPIFLPSYSLST